MAAPMFILKGKGSLLGGDLNNSGVLPQVYLAGCTAYLSANTKGFLGVDNQMSNVETVEVDFDENGWLNGPNGVGLLAQDSSLSLNRQLTWHITVKGMFQGRERTFHSFDFLAGEDGEVITLDEVARTADRGRAGSTLVGKRGYRSRLVKVSDGPPALYRWQDETGVMWGGTQEFPDVDGILADADWGFRHPGTSIPTGRIAFNTKADALFAGLPTILDSGQPISYNDTGQSYNRPTLVDGGLGLTRGVGAGGSVFYADLDAGVGNLMRRIGGRFRIDPTGASTHGWVNCLSITNGYHLYDGGTAYRIGIHLTFNADTWALQKVSNGTGSLVTTTLVSGYMLNDYLEDGTEYACETYLVDNTATILLPDGQRVQWTDDDFGTWSGRYGFFETVLAAKSTDSIPKWTEVWFSDGPQVAPSNDPVRVTRDGAETLQSKTLIAPKVDYLADLSGLTALSIAHIASAVNYAQLFNAATTVSPKIAAAGADTNIGLALVTKGTGVVTVNAVPIVDTTSTQILNHKLFPDDGFTLYDPADATKLATLNVPPGQTTGTTRVHTLPAVNSNLASEAYVTSAISALVGGAGAALDTLNELATALGNDANFATTTATALATKVAQVATLNQVYGTDGAGAQTTIARATAATASTLALRDSQGNILAGSFVPGYTTTPSAATTTTLTTGSNEIQWISGSTTHIFQMPSSSVVAGRSWRFCNSSTGTVTITASDGTTITTIASGTSKEVRARFATPATNTSWMAY